MPIVAWRYVMFFRNLGYYLQLIGAKLPNSPVEISTKELDEDPMSMALHVVRELKKIRDSGEIDLSPKNLGDGSEWDRLAFDDMKF